MKRRLCFFEKDEEKCAGSEELTGHLYTFDWLNQTEREVTDCHDKPTSHPSTTNFFLRGVCGSRNCWLVGSNKSVKWLIIVKHPLDDHLHPTGRITQRMLLLRIKLCGSITQISL